MTVESLGEYVHRCVRALLIDGVAAQMQAVIRGFNEVFPVSALSMFAPSEVCEPLNKTWFFIYKN